MIVTAVTIVIVTMDLQAAAAASSSDTNDSAAESVRVHSEPPLCNPIVLNKCMSFCLS